MALLTILSPLLSLLLIVLLHQLSPAESKTTVTAFRPTTPSLREATLADLQLALNQNKLKSTQLMEFYLGEIRRLNPHLHGAIEVNLDALFYADKADRERKANSPVSHSILHGIPVLVKDNIATKDKLNTTAGSFTLLCSIVPRDFGVVTKLRKAGAIILGKASMTKWAAFKSTNAHNGWSARGGQGVNPYDSSSTPCGSSSGSAISVAANMAAVTLGTEIGGSILCPSNFHSVVGLKPTVGLASRAGVVPISPRQDTVGPICRTMSDAVHVLDAIVGIDHNYIATVETSKYIPKGGYAQFLRRDGLKWKRIGIVRDPFFDFGGETFLNQTFEQHFKTLGQGGAVLVDHLKITNVLEIYGNSSGEQTALETEFKIFLNAYLKELVSSHVRSLADVIAFNNKNSKLEKLKDYGQDILISAEATKGMGNEWKAAVSNLARLTKNGFEKLMKKNKLDALVTARAFASPVLAIGGFPGIIVPAGFRHWVPIGICFGGLKGSEPKLIEIAYAFEQATKIRKPPPLKF